MRAILTLTLFLFAGPALAQEKFIRSDVELRTHLSFKASDAAVQKLLPEGWEINSPTAGPNKGANVTVVLVEQVLSNDADGKPAETFRGAALVFFAKKKGTDAAIPMMFGGLFEQPASPGPWGVFALAQSAIERRAQTGADKKLIKEEHWRFNADGATVEVQIQYAPAAPTASKIEQNLYSAAKPDFYRIDRVEQAVDVLRSAATGVDRITKLSFKASGEKFGQLFDGTEQLISVISIPYASRKVYLPGS
jgi:hypothetical protein